MIEEITNAINAVLPEQLGEEIKLAIRRSVQSALEGADVVSKEEFERQQEVLLKTRDKVTALEAKISELETLVAAGRDEP